MSTSERRLTSRPFLRALKPTKPCKVSFNIYTESAPKFGMSAKLGKYPDTQMQGRPELCLQGKA